tara:strand:+ start:605125 stop:605505 length:381 start_codon:yes stop_codon:yes gene_type:complete
MTRLFAGTPFDIPPTCDDCGNEESQCVCDPAEKAERERQQLRASQLVSPSQQTARVLVEKRKGNRRVTVVSGLTSQANDLPNLLSQLQSACGTGGTVKAKDDTIELQGDHSADVRGVLAEIGYRLK